MLAAVVWSGWLSLRERSNELEDQAATMAQTIAAFVDRDLGELDTLGRTLADVPAVRTFDAAATQRLFSRAMGSRSAILRLELVSGSGEEVAAEGAGELGLDSIEWAASALASADRALIPPVAGHHSNYAILGYPVRDDSRRTIGALGLFVNLQSLQDAFDSVKLAAGSVVTVASLDGRILLRNIDSERFVGSLTPGSPRSGVTPPHPAVGLDGVERVYARADANVGPWLISVGLPMSTAFDCATSLWSRSLVILFGAVASWLFIALILTNRLVDAVGYLDDTAQRIASTLDRSRPKKMFSLEFAELQTAFESMPQRFNATRAPLDAQMGEERRVRRELESLQGQVIRRSDWRPSVSSCRASRTRLTIRCRRSRLRGAAAMQPDVPESCTSDLSMSVARAPAPMQSSGIWRCLPVSSRPRLPGWSVSEVIAPSRSFASVVWLEDIELQVEDTRVNRRHRRAAELQQVLLNFVVNAEQAILARDGCPGASPSDVRPRPIAWCWRSRIPVRYEARRTRSQALRAVLHDEARRARARVWAFE